MSALGQKRTWRSQIVMSALPPRADTVGAIAAPALAPRQAALKKQKQISPTGPIRKTAYGTHPYPRKLKLKTQRPEIQDRIGYLTRQDEELIAEKRRRIEETLWSMHEADIGEFFETYETAKTDKNGSIETDENGKMLTVERERPRRLSNIPAEMRRNIEKVVIDSRGNPVPQLYSKLAASQELRKMLNIGGQKDRPETDV
jgi:hypothetical protein